jgi:aconitase A
MATRATPGPDRRRQLHDPRRRRLQPRQDVTVEVTRKDGSSFTFTALCRIDTANEVEYFMNGGILHYVLRKLAA